MLLKNDNNLLPLKGCRKVAVVGPLADSKANMAGSWKYDEQTKSYHGLVEDLQESLKWSRGCFCKRQQSSR